MVAMGAAAAAVAVVGVATVGVAGVTEVITSLDVTLTFEMTSSLVGVTVVSTTFLLLTASVAASRPRSLE